MLGEGAVLEGTLRAEGDVRVSGRVVGDLHVEGRVILTPEGAVDGTLSATHADVAGRLEGEARVTERLVLKSDARVDGTINAGRVVIEEGALFTGSCAMNGRASVPPEIAVRPEATAGEAAASEKAASADEAPADRKEKEAASDPVS